ncbi:hypothetical protein FRB96_003317 [Tulasnella sp. 330]|nr:hypothetical protein FRB96_003317 [Tulasnella sp. 330]
MHQLLAGALELEARDVVHADIKPQNVMLSQDGYLVFFDFGFTRIGGLVLVSGRTDGHKPNEMAFGLHWACNVFASGVATCESDLAGIRTDAELGQGLGTRDKRARGTRNS